MLMVNLKSGVIVMQFLCNAFEEGVINLYGLNEVGSCWCSYVRPRAKKVEEEDCGANF